jgi:branched-chain amino acid transport system permease protein
MELEGLLRFLAGFAILAGIYAVFALGLNIHWGYTGLFNIGIAGFFAIGAYTSALVTKPLPHGELAQYVRQAIGLDQPFLVGVMAAMVASGVVAFFIGFLTLRLREDYLAIATIGIAESIRLFFNNERWLANGAQGLVGLPQPLHDLVDPRFYSYVYLGIVLVFLVVIYILLERGIRSPWGRVLRAIREDEVTAKTSGKNVFAFKLHSLVLGAMVMGLGGALYAHYVAAIQPSTFEPLFGTFLIWVMLMLGGSGNSKGAILGAFVVWAIWEGTGLFLHRVLPVTWDARAPFIRFTIIGLLLLTILLLRPQGILGEEKQVSKLIE